MCVAFQPGSVAGAAAELLHGHAIELLVGREDVLDLAHVVLSRECVRQPFLAEPRG